MKRVFSDNETDDITEITQVKDAMEEPSKKKQQVAASPRVTCSATTATVETKRKKLTAAKRETENQQFIPTSSLIIRYGVLFPPFHPASQSHSQASHTRLNSMLTTYPPHTAFLNINRILTHINSIILHNIPHLLNPPSKWTYPSSALTSSLTQPLHSHGTCVGSLDWSLGFFGTGSDNDGGGYGSGGMGMG
ncbi:hypothetical protein M422DRAFT_275164 [Sphaerobolus stellatus SS14]|uniref:Uncharacterized protein n=1 Tax=Sphaerobolus stellatus (strain SS14) TaxID=990650 RepID=A0A0C9T5G3_SPHS4|nr:hypothetical protein M422DRAFT_275164 [Sphaerobolus stellatus SS14]